MTDEIHLNSASMLPPVGCPLLIEIGPGRLIEAERTGHLTTREQEMEYVLANGFVLIGRFRWTYP